MTTTAELHCQQTTAAGRDCTHAAKGKLADGTLACGRHLKGDTHPLDWEPEGAELTGVLGALAELTQAVTLAYVTIQARGALDEVPQPVLPDAIGLVQDAISALRGLERDLTVNAGQRLGVTGGELADGRPFTLKRTQDRTAWDHEDWKRDVRRIVTDRTLAGYLVPEDMPGFLINGSTGEAETMGRVIQEALTMAQEVHGSTAPRSTALKRLGLYAGDYSASTPGGWKLTAETKNDPTATTKD